MHELCSVNGLLSNITLVVSRKESKAFMSAESSGSTEARDGGSVFSEPRLMLQYTESGG